jgi:hypothetical protein
MELTLTGNLAKQLLTRTKGDTQLAAALAAEYLAQVDPMDMARYLLTPQAALGLLVERLQTAPESTMRELSVLQDRQRGAARPTRGGRKAKATTKPAPKPAAKTTAKPGKRVRLSEKEIDGLKNAVRSLLQRHGWATRKQICDAAELPTMSIYNRVMAELQRSGEVAAKGEKGKRVYGLKGAGKTTSPTPPTKAKATPKAKPAPKQAKAAKAKRPPLACPVPGCKNKAAPVFGMMCRDHKDLPKAERDKLFAARRKAAG